MHVWRVKEQPGAIETDPLEWVETPIPQPGPGEALIHVLACGVCRTDLHVSEGDLPAHLPHVTPGHEIVGEVEALGGEDDQAFSSRASRHRGRHSNANRNGDGNGFGDATASATNSIQLRSGSRSRHMIQVGERVGVAWLRHTCGTCEFCRAGRENLCQQSQYTGWDANGGYAEYAIAPIDYLYSLEELLGPRKVSSDTRREGTAHTGRRGRHGGASSADSSESVDKAIFDFDLRSSDPVIPRLSANGLPMSGGANGSLGGSVAGGDPTSDPARKRVPSATANDRYTVEEAAPLLCAGIIGYRALKRTGLLDGISATQIAARSTTFTVPTLDIRSLADMTNAARSGNAGGTASDATTADHTSRIFTSQAANHIAAKLGHTPVLGLYGFGGSAHITAQVALALGMRVHVLTRCEDAQRLALQLGCSSAAGAYDMPPEPLDAAIIFAPVGAIALPALKALRPGGVLSLAGIHMSDLPPLNYEKHLFHEKEIRSVESNTRQDGLEFLAFAATHHIHIDAHPYPLAHAQQALKDLKAGRFAGAAVLVTE